MKVMIFGTFDRLHPGHVFVFDEARQRGRVTVVVGRDRNVGIFKGKQPCENQEERLHNVRAAFPEAQVMLGDSSDFLMPIRKIKPDLILLGYDQKLPPGIREEQLGCQVERLPAHLPDRFKTSLMP